MNCDICFHNYDSEERVPLVLQCGHSFCSVCVGRTARPRACFLCGREEPRKITAIPRNFALLDAAEQATKQNQRRARSQQQEQEQLEQHQQELQLIQAQQQQQIRDLELRLQEALEANARDSQQQQQEEQQQEQQERRQQQEQEQPVASSSTTSSSSGSIDPSLLQLSHTQLRKGSSGVGTVMQGLYNGREVAVKLVPLWSFTPAAQEALLEQVSAALRNAAACPSSCCHYEGACLSNAHLLLVMRLYSRSLAGFMEERKGLGLPRQWLLQRSQQLLIMLQGLHSKHMAAFDLKPSNLLIVEPTQQQQQQGLNISRDCVVLADSFLHYVLARISGDIWPTEAALADPYFRPPEYFTAMLPGGGADSHDAPFYAEAADMWAFACVVMYMATGKPPLSHLSPTRVVALIAAQGHLPLDTPTTTPPDSVPQPLKELIQACLVAEPDERPSVADALQVVQQLLRPSSRPDRAQDVVRTAALPQQQQQQPQPQQQEQPPPPPPPQQQQQLQQQPQQVGMSLQPPPPPSRGAPLNGTLPQQQHQQVFARGQGLESRPNSNNNTVGMRDSNGSGSSYSGGRRDSSSGGGAALNGPAAPVSTASAAAQAGASSSSNSRGAVMANGSNRPSSSPKSPRSSAAAAEAVPPPPVVANGSSRGKTSSSAANWRGGSSSSSGAVHGNGTSAADGRAPAAGTATASGASSSSNGASSSRQGQQPTSSAAAAAAADLPLDVLLQQLNSKNRREVVTAAASLASRATSWTDDSMVTLAVAQLLEVLSSYKHKTKDVVLTAVQTELCSALLQLVKADPAAAAAAPNIVKQLLFMAGEGYAPLPSVAREYAMACLARVTAADAAAAAEVDQQGVRRVLSCLMASSQQAPISKECVMENAALVLATLPGVDISSANVKRRLVEDMLGSKENERWRIAAAKAIHQLVTTSQQTAALFADAVCFPLLIKIVADDTWDVQEDAAEPAAAAAAALAPLLDGPSIIAAQDSLSFWEWVPNLVMCLSKTQFPAAQQAAVVALEMLTKESTDMSIALLASQDCVTALGQLLSSSSGVGGGGRRWRVAQAAAGALANLGSGSCATSCCKQMVREPGLVAQLVAILSDPEVDTRVELQAARCVLALVADPSNVAGRRAVAAVPGSNVRLQACSTSPNGELKSIAQRIITCLQN